MVTRMLGKIAVWVLIISLILALFVGLMQFLLYGLGDEHLNDMNVHNVEAHVVTNKGMGGDFNLGDLPNRGDTDYRGQAYEGYLDPQQVNMAKEYLDILSNTIEKEGTLLQRLAAEVGNQKAKDLLMETIIGIHATESSTYSSNIRNSWKSETGVPGEKTYILSNYPVYKNYSKVQTVDGKTMNFTNFNYKDYNKARLEEDPNVTYTTDTASTYFHAGYWSTSHRSVSGATGPLQQRVMYWTNDHEYVKNAEQGFVTDAIKFVEESDKSGWSSILDSPNPDIWNFPDQVESLYKNFIVQHIDVFVDRVGSIKDFELIQGHIFATYHGGTGTHGGNVGSKEKLDVFHEYINTMYSDKGFFDESFQEFKSKKSHGDFRNINIKYKQKNNFGDGLAIDYKGFTAGQYSSEYYTKAKFEGVAWYDFLRGIAYGDRTDPNNPDTNRPTPSGNKGRIVYNYMKETNGVRKSQGNLKNSDLDNYSAIGYKGPFPIFNQNMDYNSKLYMGGGYTFKSACTIYAATSGMLGLGETPIYRGFDTSGNGTTTPSEFWSHAHSNRTSTPYDITKPPSFGLASVHGTIVNAGYETSGTYSAKGNIQMRKEHIKQGYPVHLRTSGGTSYPGIIPKISLSELDYRQHDMYDFDSYDWSNTKNYKLASNGHSLIAVDLIEYRGKEYISLIDSAYNHSNGYDSSIIWWEAGKLLEHSDWANSYTIFGGEGLSPIDTGLGEGQSPVTGTGPAPRPTTSYDGEESGVAVYDLNSGDLKEIGLDKNEYSNNTGTSIVGTIKGGYETRLIEGQRYEGGISTGMYIITGKSNDLTQAIEIKGITNPRKHDKGNREFTELYDLPSGQTAHVRTGFFRKGDGMFIYTDIRND